MAKKGKLKLKARSAKTYKQYHGQYIAYQKRNKNKNKPFITLNKYLKLNLTLNKLEHVYWEWVEVYKANHDGKEPDADESKENVVEEEKDVVMIEDEVDIHDNFVEEVDIKR